jgi:hypothetical protein
VRFGGLQKVTEDLIQTAVCYFDTSGRDVGFCLFILIALLQNEAEQHSPQATFEPATLCMVFFFFFLCQLPA